jgi:hypothetical protein
MTYGCVEEVGAANERTQQYQGEVTLYVVIECMVVSIGDPSLAIILVYLVCILK